MALPVVKTTMQAVVATQDASGAQPLGRTNGGTLTGTFGQFTLDKVLPVLGTEYSIQLPGTPATAWMVKNANAAGNITVKIFSAIAPSGVAVFFLAPGGFVMGCEQAPAANSGITGVSLTPDTNNLVAELYFGG